MKIIRSVLIIFCLFQSVSFYGQINDSTQNVNALNSYFYTSSQSLKDQTYVLKNLKIQSEGQDLVLYNSTTNLYDVYLDVDNTYSYSGSTSMFRSKSNFFTTASLGNNSGMENNILLPRTSVLLGENVSYPVRDSFNPHGASNFKEAILGGVLGLIFN